MCGRKIARAGVGARSESRVAWGVDLVSNWFDEI